MDVMITKIEPQTPPEESIDVMKEETIEITSTPSIMDTLERVEQPLLSQSERNTRQMSEDENLIFSVKKFPIIYDRTNPNYQNKEQVRHIWSVIAENSNRSPDYCHKRWRYLRDYFVRQLRFHRSVADPSKLRRPWVLFNKLTFLIPFVSHVVDKSNIESESIADNKTISLHDYLSRIQNENYYECEETEINDLTMDLNADPTGEKDDFNQQNFSQQLYGPSNNKKRKVNSFSGSEPLAKSSETVNRMDYSLDEHDHFLYSLAPEIRKIDPKFTLHFRNEVHNLIMKYRSMSTNEE